MIDDSKRNKLTSGAKAGYHRVNSLSGGTVGILVDTFQSFTSANAAESAASMAYYALFSLFPLLIFMVGIGSFVLESKQVQEHVLRLTNEFFPSSQEFVTRNIQQVLALRGPAGLVATIGLLWSASGVFNSMVRNVNRAWHTAGPRNFLHGRLIAVAMVFALALLLILSVLSTPLFAVLQGFNINVPVLGGTSVYQTSLWTLLTAIIPWALTFIMFISLYRWAPNTRVGWLEPAIGALVASLTWELLKFGFSWYLTSGMASFNVVYGSLGTVLVLMLWIYLSGMIVLFGAHLSAAIARYRE